MTRRPLFMHIAYDRYEAGVDKVNLCGKPVENIVPKGITPLFVCGRCVVISIEDSDRQQADVRKMRDENRHLHRRLNEVADALTRDGAARTGIKRRRS